MLAVARQVAPDIDWREGNAAALPLTAQERFDVVTCQQGFQFFPDKPAAAQQLRSALAPHGRVALTTWRTDEDFPVLRALRAAAERHVGPVDDRRHSLGDPSEVEELLRSVGLRDVRSRTQTRTIRFQDGMTFVRLNAMALVGMSAAGKDATDADRERLIEVVVTESTPIVKQNTGSAGFSYDIGTNVTTGKV
jgi:ubiquinone/menaquinone biosynthesis C-methylase UbiE